MWHTAKWNGYWPCIQGWSVQSSVYYFLNRLWDRSSHYKCTKIHFLNVYIGNMFISIKCLLQMLTIDPFVCMKRKCVDAKCTLNLCICVCYSFVSMTEFRDCWIPLTNQLKERGLLCDCNLLRSPVCFREHTHCLIKFFLTHSSLEALYCNLNWT